MRLGQGDMRRVLNLLQSTHMAYQKARGGFLFVIWKYGRAPASSSSLSPARHLRSGSGEAVFRPSWHGGFDEGLTPNTLLKVLWQVTAFPC